MATVQDILNNIKAYSEVVQAEIVQVRDVKNADGKIIRKDHIVAVSYTTPQGIIAQDTVVIAEFLDDQGNVINAGLTKPLTLEAIRQQQAQQPITLTEDEIVQALKNVKIKFMDFIIKDKKESPQKATAELVVYEDQVPAVKSYYVVSKDNKGNIVVRQIRQ